MGVNLSLRLVLANSPLYDPRFASNRQRTQRMAVIYHAQKLTLDVTWMPDASGCEKSNDDDSTHHTIKSMPRGTLVTEYSTSRPSTLLARSINFMRTTYLNGQCHQNLPSVNTRSRVPTQHIPTSGKVTVNSPRHHEMPY